MSKLFSRRALAVLALAFPTVALADITVTMSPNTKLNLDTGKIVTSAADIGWDGTNMTPLRDAGVFDLTSITQEGGSSYYNSLTQTELVSFASIISVSPITPAANDVIAASSNGGNFAKILVQSISGGSITLEFVTYTGSPTGPAAPSGPTITAVVNNYSFIPPGFPNSGISPGTIFSIFGSGLSATPPVVALASSASPGIPKNLEGATLSVSVGGTTVQPAMYFATPGQIAAVLPSGTPTGSATITVSYNGATSNAFSFQVVPYALGLNTYFGSGSGLVLATDNGTGEKITYTNSAKPGETIVLYGSGLGADTADSDTVFTSSPHAVKTPLQIYIGGVSATIVYAGSSGYPGYDQIDVTIPDNVALSCYVGLVGVTGSGGSTTVSNFGSLAISASGGACDDSVFGISGTTVSSLSGQANVSFGDLFVGQLIQPTSTTNNTPQTTNIASGIFEKVTGAYFTSSSTSAFSSGSCFVSEVISISGTLPTVVGLDAGSINLAGPGGSYPLMSFSKGFYDAELPSGAITSSGGAFTFTGSGGADVGSLKTTINLPNPLLDWTNQSAGATVNRAQGVQVNWTGGAPGSYVIIEGNAFDLNTGASGNFTCVANQSALTFTVPGYVTSTLPAASGTLGVENVSNYNTFSASGLDFGLAFGLTSTTINSKYQ